MKLDTQHISRTRNCEREANFDGDFLIMSFVPHFNLFVELELDEFGLSNASNRSNINSLLLSKTFKFKLSNQ